MNKLPHWCITDLKPAFYDTESATAIEQTAKLYGAMQDLITEYNNFVDRTNEEIEKFENDVNANIEVFKVDIRQEFQDFVDVVETHLQVYDKKFADFKIEVRNEYAKFTSKIENAMSDFKVEVGSILANQDTNINTFKSDMVKSFNDFTSSMEQDFEVYKVEVTALIGSTVASEVGIAKGELETYVDTQIDTKTSTLSSQVAINTSDINDLQIDVEVLKATGGAGDSTGDLTGIITDIQDLETRVGLVETSVEKNSTDITLKVSQDTYSVDKGNIESDLSSLENRVESAESSIIANANNIELKVAKDTYTNDKNIIEGDISSLEDRMTSAEASINVNTSNIALKVNKDEYYTAKENIEGDVTDLTDRMVSAEASIIANANNIELKVAKDTYTSDKNMITGNIADLTTRVESAESSISLNEDNIALKVSKGDVSAQLSLENEQITITGNRLVVDSTNFKLTQAGNVTTKGDITSLGKITIEDDSIGITTELKSELRNDLEYKYYGWQSGVGMNKTSSMSVNKPTFTIANNDAIYIDEVHSSDGQFNKLYGKNASVDTIAGNFAGFDSLEVNTLATPDGRLVGWKNVGNAAGGNSITVPDEILAKASEFRIECVLEHEDNPWLTLDFVNTVNNSATTRYSVSNYYSDSYFQNIMFLIGNKKIVPQQGWITGKYNGTVTDYTKLVYYVYWR